MNGRTRLAAVALVMVGLSSCGGTSASIVGTASPTATATATATARAKVSPAPAVSLGVEYVDGCDHHYGNPNQCVPMTFPKGTTNKCAWLRSHGFGPLPVAQRDKLGLDTNHDGIACDTGDS